MQVRDVVNKYHLSNVQYRDMVEAGDAIYIGRPSKWGNPFVIGKDGDRKQVLEKFLTHLRSRQDLLDALPELNDKILVCYCMPQRCHGHILAEALAALDR